MAGTQILRITASEIPNSVEKRIVEMSLQQPDYGASRLVPLLEQEGILLNSSAVYTILKRNNLQNRTLRLAKLEVNRTAEILSEPADTIPEQAEVSAHAPTPTGETTPKPRMPAAAKIPSTTRVRNLWSLSPVNILLLGLVGYFWVSALGNLLEARREPTMPHVLSPAVIEARTEAPVRPLEDYNIILERNLFGGSQGEAPEPLEEVPLEGLPVSLKFLGLKLVGTVVGDDAAMSLAIIDDQSTRKQDLYHEGVQVGQILLKKILRNKVVLSTAKGDQVLTMEFEDVSQSPIASQRPAAGQLPETVSRANPAEREDQNSAFFDPDEFMQQVQISPYMQGEEPAGATITGTGKNLARLRLRSGDVITGVNGQAITDPDQARQAFEKVSQGKEVTLDILRQHRPRKIRLR